MSTVFTTGMQGPDATNALNKLWDRVTDDAFSTSSTNLSVASGSISLITEPYKKWAIGQYVGITWSGSTAVYMRGTVSSYSPSNGSMSVLVDEISGSGTYSNWSVALSGSYTALTAAYVESINNVQDLRLMLIKHIAAHT